MSDDLNHTSGGTQYVNNWYNGYAGVTTNSDNTYSGTAGYNFIVFQGQATTGIQTDDYGTIKLASMPRDSSSIGGSGGKYLAADGAYESSLISQVISGLIIGNSYDVTFDWAGAQQQGSGYNQDTNSAWTVALGTDMNHYTAFTTQSITVPEQGFTGWYQQTFTFKAIASTETLGFMASGGPNGQPPFALLDDVSMTEHVAAVPEPASWAMMIGGFGLVGFSLRKRRGTSALAA
jgi:hypothetical protein